jgi:hypothetical protein
MKTPIASLLISFYLTNSFGQTAVINLSPAKTESSGLSFSVQTVAQTNKTNTTQFTVVISCTERRPDLPATFYATLRTTPEPPIIRTEIINGKTVQTRRKMDNEKGDRIAPSSATTNQTNSIVYSLRVPDDKLPDATFMFWTPGVTSRPPPSPHPHPPTHPAPATTAPGTNRSQDDCCADMQPHPPWSRLPSEALLAKEGHNLDEFHLSPSPQRYHAFLTQMPPRKPRPAPAGTNEPLTCTSGQNFFHKTLDVFLAFTP